jgi:hypothetical protein
MTDKLNKAGDRIIWMNQMEMLDDIWLARQERDRWRAIAEKLAERLSYDLREANEKQ